MTVQQLIDALSEIRDRQALVYVNGRPVVDVVEWQPPRRPGLRVVIR